MSGFPVAAPGSAARRPRGHGRASGRRSSGRAEALVPCSLLEAAPLYGLNQVFPAIVAQAGIFTAIHATKHPAELVASFPGALGLGMLTYRARSAWPGFVLHLATSATFLAVVHRAAR